MGDKAGPGGSDGARKRKPDGLSRRAFVGLGSAGAAGVVAGSLAGYFAHPAAAEAVTEATPPPALRFFNPIEAPVVTAMAERIFPKDQNGPGATDARVINYIDGMLAGGWGNGERFYRQAPFATPTTSGHGWQYPQTPAMAYRDALPAIATYTQQKYGKTFDKLTTSQQDDVLTAMSKGEIKTFPTVSSADFFAMFRENVLEGLFGDPLYGGNYQMAGWKWLGFPGNPAAYGDPYARWIEKYNTPYKVSPKPLNYENK